MIEQESEVEVSDIASEDYEKTHSQGSIS